MLDMVDPRAPGQKTGSADYLHLVHYLGFPLRMMTAVWWRWLPLPIFWRGGERRAHLKKEKPGSRGKLIRFQEHLECVESPISWRGRQKRSMLDMLGTGEGLFLSCDGRGEHNDRWSLKVNGKSGFRALVCLSLLLDKEDGFLRVE